MMRKVFAVGGSCAVTHRPITNASRLEDHTESVWLQAHLLISNGRAQDFWPVHMAVAHAPELWLNYIALQVAELTSVHHVNRPHGSL